jgi:large subunit ribosomal protein L9
MDVILLEKIDNLGGIGDRVKVRSGYGRNYLLPKGKATLATPGNIAVFEARRVELEQKEVGDLAASEARGEQIRELTLQLPARAGLRGKLFGSIGTIDIANACAEAGVPVERSEVRLPDGPIRALGDYDIEIHLHADLNVSIRVQVVPDGELVADDVLEGAEGFAADGAADDATDGDGADSPQD